MIRWRLRVTQLEQAIDQDAVMPLGVRIPVIDLDEPAGFGINGGYPDDMASNSSSSVGVMRGSYLLPRML
jgi:hypothetical protein